jgi:hypothetical protein
MMKWEYVTTPVLLHKETQILNTWGNKGWELVQVVTGAQGGLIAFFKRPLQASEELATGAEATPGEQQ